MYKVNLYRHQNNANDVVLVSLLLTLNIFHTLFQFSIINFEQVNPGCVRTKKQLLHVQIGLMSNRACKRHSGMSFQISLVFLKNNLPEKLGSKKISVVDSTWINVQEYPHSFLLIRGVFKNPVQHPRWSFLRKQLTA